MAKVTFQYALKNKKGLTYPRDSFDQWMLKQVNANLKRKFPSATIAKEERYRDGVDTFLFSIQFEHTSVVSLNNIIQREVLSQMSSTKVLSGKHMPQINVDGEHQLVLTNHHQFLNYSELGMPSKNYATPLDWEQWLLWVELASTKEDLKKDIQSLPNETYGDKILVLLKTEGHEEQALSLLESVKDELSKAELTTLLNAIEMKMYGLERTIG